MALTKLELNVLAALIKGTKKEIQPVLFCCIQILMAL